MSCKSVMLVSRVVAFSWVGDTRCWVEGTSCLGCSRRRQSSFQTVASKFVTTRLNVLTHREAQMVLKSATKKFFLYQEISSSICGLTVVAHLISLLISFVVNFSFLAVWVWGLREKDFHRECCG